MVAGQTAYGKPSTAAAIVAYNPNLALLTSVLRAIGPQVDAVLVVDNTEHPQQVRATAALCAAEGASYDWLGRNLGIGAAHNVAIQWASVRGDTWLVLLDQDSIAAPDMVQALGQVMLLRRAAGEHLAAVGPCYGYKHGRVDSFFIQFQLPLWKRFYAEKLPPGSVIRTDCLISSGTLFATDALQAVGPMRSDLFIDHVDTEWFLRAAAQGWHAYGVRDAVMTHALGEGTLKLWIGRWRNYPLHVPERYYYTFRNSLKLYREQHAGIPWMLFDFARLVAIFAISVTRSPNRLANLRNILLGIRDGIQRRGGKRQD